MGPAILVTGAGGQLGRALRALAPNATFLERERLDITDGGAVKSALDVMKPAAVINAAAYTHVDRAESEPGRAEAVNTLGARILAEGAAQVHATTVYPSTNFVFSGRGPDAYDETQPTSPLSVYGRTKANGEAAVLEENRNLVVRTSAVYGEGANFIRAIIAAARTRPEVRVVDDQWCQPTGAFELATGILDLIEQEASGIFHVAGGPPCTWAELAEHALKVTGSSVRVIPISTEEYIASRSGPTAPRPLRAVLECSKAEARGLQMSDWKMSVDAYLGRES
ncbi:MAG TPA: dTDP-4-dehydrorhamnose reductase [Actinomycetota bacterium]|nr:dTDP-4-dehydrorhamnose reductase [Actinomycetota bacterium]